MESVCGRDVVSGRSLRVEVESGTISRISPGEPAAEDCWIAPAFWDIQLNGRWGISFSDPALTIEQVAEIVLAQAPLGTARLCPTLITAPREALEHGVRTIAAACERYPEVRARVLGIHLEGPHISRLDGYRGAHPIAAVREPDAEELEHLQSMSGGRIALVTLAPEHAGSTGFIERAVSVGIVVALGHTAAGGEAIRQAVAAGATLSTHLGNGIAAELARHPNPIWHQAAEDRLFASVIADGHHLDAATLCVLARAKGVDRLILVSDASPLAGLPPGDYGPWSVDPAGKIVVTRTPYLAGSNQGLDVGVANLVRATGWTLAEAWRTVTTNPARLLGRPLACLQVGQPANLVRFRWEAAADRAVLELLDTCVDGTLYEIGG